ncbi:MAG: periplasmic heavy metal sensor, partial [Desulfovibrionaceae bacterium]
TRQALLRQLLHEHKADIVPRFEKLWSLRDEVTRAMAAEPFDRPALEALFAQLRDQESDVAASAQRMLADLLERLPPEDRAKVAALMPVRPPRPPDDGK